MKTASLIHNLGLRGLTTIEETDAALKGFMSRLGEVDIPQLRADAADGAPRSADRHVEAVRACVHATVKQQRRFLEMRADSADIPEHREAEIGEAILEGLGLRADNGEVYDPALRADSHYFVGDLSAKSTSLIRPNDQVEMVRTAIPRRMVPAYAEYFDIDRLSETGEAALLTPGQTQGFNRVDHALERNKGKMHWIGIATHTSWSDAFLSAAPSAVDHLSENSRIARRAIERKTEQLLIQGVSGLDFQGLANLGVPRILSSVDFSTATLGERTAEMTRLLQRIRQAAGFVGATPSVGLIDPRLAFSFRGANNIDAGGNIVGSGPLMQAMSNEGLRSVVEAPTMERWWSSPRGNNYAQMVIFNPATDGRLEQIQGLMAAPVSTAEHHGTETLYASRIGGLSAGDVSSIAILDIKIS